MQQTAEYYERLNKGYKEFWREATSSRANWERTVRSLNLPEDVKTWLIDNAKFPAKIESLNGVQEF